MIEEFKYEGEWWIPKNPENKVRGTLYFSPKDGIKLDLLGLFEENEQTIFEVILGSTIDGKEITLTRCMQYAYEKHVPGGEISKLHISEIFIGEHFSSLSAIEFNRISIHFSYMNE